MRYRKVPGFSFSVNRSSSFNVLRARFASAVQENDRRQLEVVKRAALMAQRAIKQTIRNGGVGGSRFKPLSPVTRLLRKGSKPLIDRGSLLGSITVTVDAKSKAAFVGVHRTAHGTDGQPLVNVAAAHEFGTKPYQITVTAGLRRLFFYLHRISGGAIQPISPSKTVIFHPGVPARPFMRPTLKAIRPQLQSMLVKAFTERGGLI